jgi:hypothetical protein
MFKFAQHIKKKHVYDQQDELREQHWPKHRMPYCICWLFQGQQAGRLMKNQVWTGVYTVILVEGQDMPDCGQGDIYVRFRLGDQRVRSKVSSSLSCFLFFPCSLHHCVSFFVSKPLSSFSLNTSLNPSLPLFLLPYFLSCSHTSL